MTETAPRRAERLASHRRLALLVVLGGGASVLMAGQDRPAEGRTQEPGAAAPTAPAKPSASAPGAAEGEDPDADESGPLASSFFHRGWLQELLDRDVAAARRSYEQGRASDVLAEQRWFATYRLWELDWMQANEAGLRANRVPGAPVSVPEDYADLVHELRALREAASPPRERLEELRAAALAFFRERNREGWRFTRGLLARMLERLHSETPALHAITEQRREAQRARDTAHANELRRQELEMRRSLRQSQPSVQSRRRWTIDILKHRLDGRSEAASRLEEELRQKLTRGPVRSRPTPDLADLKRRLEQLPRRLEQVNYLDNRERRIVDAALSRARELAEKNDLTAAWELLRPLYFLSF